MILKDLTGARHPLLAPLQRLGPQRGHLPAAGHQDAIGGQGPGRCWKKVQIMQILALTVILLNKLTVKF